MKVVVDTNVLISGLISTSSPPARIIDLWLSNRLNVYVSPEIIEEYLSVFLRPKFRRVGTPQERYELISELLDLDNTIVVNPDFRLTIITDDVDDNIILECAVEAAVEVIVSGDMHLLSLSVYDGIEILLPAEFLQKYCGVSSRQNLSI